MIRRILPAALFALAALAEDANLEHARQVNLERAGAMPNFVADEVAKRYSGHAGSTKWMYEDTIETEITVKGIRISRQNWRRNGKPSSAAEARSMPSTGFGAALKPLFDPSCRTTLRFANREDVHGKPALIYEFGSPADGCFGNLYSRFAYNAARAGRVFIADPEGDVLRFEEDATGFPGGFGFIHRRQVMTWDSVKIGEVFHWLPVAVDFIWSYPDDSLLRISIEYRNHRHFEAASNVTYK
jgi:hypothetical protein